MGNLFKVEKAFVLRNILMPIGAGDYLFERDLPISHFQNWPLINRYNKF